MCVLWTMRLPRPNFHPFLQHLLDLTASNVELTSTVARVAKEMEQLEAPNRLQSAQSVQSAQRTPVCFGTSQCRAGPVWEQVMSHPRVTPQPRKKKGTTTV